MSGTLNIGDNWVISDLSGFKFLASECVYGVGEEAGLLMHNSEFSAYNEQLDIEVRPDNQNVSKVRDRGVDSFATPPTQDQL